MLHFDSFDALLFWHALNLARFQAWIFDGLHCYFFLDAHLRVRTISVFPDLSWNYRNLLGLFLYQ